MTPPDREVTEALPCPFCGGADIRFDCHRGAGWGFDHRGDDVWSMCCYDCGATFPNRIVCHADRDGECSWVDCPQLRDGEPAKSGRSCPHDGPYEIADRALSERTPTLPEGREAKTIISKPEWHAPKIFRAALYALKDTPHE